MKIHRSGFTLIELMIVVAVLGILTAIAYPSYQEHLRRGNRAAAQAQMMEISGRQQQFFLVNRRYAESLATLGYVMPSDISSKYTSSLTVDNDGTPPSFTIEFNAINQQAPDGDLSLDSFGTKTPGGKWR